MREKREKEKEEREKVTGRERPKNILSLKIF